MLMTGFIQHNVSEKVIFFTDIVQFSGHDEVDILIYGEDNSKND